jgi:hypothetical protein
MWFLHMLVMFVSLMLFMAWNKGRVNGKLVVLGGLSKRRAKEREWFLA